MYKNSSCAFQGELLYILERVVVTQRCTDFQALWCIYLYGCLVAKKISGCVIAFILFCNEVEYYIGVFTDQHEAKVEIFHEVQYGKLATFLVLANWATRFLENNMNWNHTLLEGTRIRTYYVFVAVINRGIYLVGIHPLLTDQEFQVYYTRSLADTIARCWVWTTEPE